MDAEIRRIKEEEFPEATALAWRVFLKYNAPGYTSDGVCNFRQFLTDEKLYELFINGDYLMFACFAEGEPRGIISLRNGNHISLLFVDENYHKMGIATSLLEYVCDYCRKKDDIDCLTVNSSPYAEDFYRHFGFLDTDQAKITDGILYTPMKYIL